MSKYIEKLWEKFKTKLQYCYQFDDLDKELFTKIIQEAMQAQREACLESLNRELLCLGKHTVLPIFEQAILNAEAQDD